MNLDERRRRPMWPFALGVVFALAAVAALAMDQPVVGRGQFRVNCASVDAGVTDTDALIPMDGGVAEVATDSVYIAPIVGSSVKVRVGFGANGLGAGTLGWEVGSSARDGAGVSLDAKNARCKSEGAAQQVDVIYGRR